MTAADRPSVPRVGDTITNAEQLDALPVGTVMRARNDLLAETGRLGADGMRVVWCEGWSEHADAIEHHAPLTVLYVPGEPSRPSVTDNARAEAPSQVTTPMIRRAVEVFYGDASVFDRWAASRAETTTEWGVRSEWTPTTDHFDNEHDARAFAARIEGRVVVRREVTAWTEADQ